MAAFAVALLPAALLAACAGLGRTDGAKLAADAGWRWEILSAGAFDLAAAVAPQPGDGTLAVYIEGDGLAYIHRDRPALDPTPTDPVALRMALADRSAAAVAWLGRPCQYTMPANGQGCRTAFWTIDRYAPEVVESAGAAIDRLKRETGANRVVLIGYSGGGVVAMLLAARRSDVERVVTVVANLDLAYWTRRDGLAPLSGSLDPAAEAERLGHVVQVHFTGADDHTVGTDVARAYLAHLPPGAPARLIEVPGFTHVCCWARDWPKLEARLGW